MHSPSAQTLSQFIFGVLCRGLGRNTLPSPSGVALSWGGPQEGLTPLPAEGAQIAKASVCGLDTSRRGKGQVILIPFHLYKSQP